MTPDLIFTAGILVIGYAVVANRLFAFARVLRNDTADIAHAIAVDARTPDSYRSRAVSSALRVTDAATAWRAVFFLVPAIYEIAIDAMRKRRGQPPIFNAPPGPVLPPDLSDKHARLVRVSLIAPLCASPAALVVFGLMISCASFAVSGLALAEIVLAKLGKKDPDDKSDYCPPAAHA